MTSDATTTGSGAHWPDYPTLLPRPLSDRQVKLLERARTHAADFRTRADRYDKNNEFPHENYEAMKASGYAHMTLEPKYGGDGVNILELCACQEQLAQGDAGTAIGVNMHIFGIGVLQNDYQAYLAGGGEPDQREMALMGVGAAKMIMSGSFSETGQPGAYGMPQTKARRVDGGWIVNGRKAYDSNAINM